VERADCIEFMTAWPSRIAAVSVVRPDGTSSTVPVWYRWEDDAMTIWTTRERAWPRHLARTGHASFSVAEDVHPYRAVTGRGSAELLTDGEIDVDREIALIVPRYIHPDLAETYIAKWNHLRDIARIRVDALHGWSLGY
jgi:hypothetical protein